ncbi:serpin family protein [Candidatus Wolfebacteria bacterium]|nr:serpin family protein [Candidatus Wolfebacteria bacterium]
MIKKNLLIILIIILFLATAVAVGLFIFPYQPDKPPHAEDVGSTVQGISEVVDANNKFAFDLYSELNNSEKGNIFYSPYSIFSALAMTYEGAKNQTASEMKSVFHFPENEILRPNFAKIYNDINENANDYDLKIGNALWAQQNFYFLEDYMDRVEKYYGGKAVNVDFANKTEETRQTINSFIEEQTKNKIKNLIPKGALDLTTRLVLTNAVYFKGDWEWQFDIKETFESDFKITPDNIIKTEMMNMKPGIDEAKFNYLDNGDLQVLELPYKGDKISMLILLPTENLDVVESNLTFEKINEYKSQMKETKLDLISLPKFEFETKYFMKETLSNLGMSSAFSFQDADFSGMTGKKDLFIGFVIHQAYIKVDEKGTEAAAATAVGMNLTSMPNFRTVFKADHPFLFMIQEKQTGNILFLGKVVNPNE